MLSRELNLRETSATTLDALVQAFGRDKWFHEFKKLKNGSTELDDNGKKIPTTDSVAHWANQNGINTFAAEGLHSKLGRLFNLTYISENPPDNPLKQIINQLENGKHIVLSFGNHERDLDYLLVSNVLTRQIRDCLGKEDQ